MRWTRVTFWALAVYAIVAALFAHGEPLLIYSAILAGVAALLFSNVPEGS